MAVDGLTGIAFGHGSEPRRRQSGKLAGPRLLERVRRASADRACSSPTAILGIWYRPNNSRTAATTLSRGFIPAANLLLIRPAPTVLTRDQTGRTLIDSWGMVGSPSNGRRCMLRQVELIRGPAEETIVVITDLDDHLRYSAADVLSAYRDHTDGNGRNKGDRGLWVISADRQQSFAGLFQLPSGSLRSITSCKYCLVTSQRRAKSRTRTLIEKLFDDARDQWLRGTWCSRTSKRRVKYFRVAVDRPTFMATLRKILKMPGPLSGPKPSHNPIEKFP